MTQGGTQTCDLANGLPCSNQLSYQVTQKLSGWVQILKAELPSTQLCMKQLGGGDPSVYETLASPTIMSYLNLEASWMLTMEVITDLLVCWCECIVKWLLRQRGVSQLHFFTCLQWSCDIPWPPIWHVTMGMLRKRSIWLNWQCACITWAYLKKVLY